MTVARAAGNRWDRMVSSVSDLGASLIVKRPGCLYLNGDCRMLLPKLPDNVVDCVITSPPYGRLKNYGTLGQIGYGQKSTDGYLKDLGRVLREFHRVCRVGGALWVVLDTVKTSGKTLLLPWEIIRSAQEGGWTFEDLVIWDKGRSLPWTHKGHFRGVFEYILLFGKSKLTHFEIGRARETDDLSPYWVKYPERYNPNGKSPSDIWHFPIPVQGSWSRNGIRHFCPFPLPMVARMISLTAPLTGVVLDPFAGTGTVLAAATFLGRNAIGIDVSTAFARVFERGGYDSLTASARAQLKKSSKGQDAGALRRLILRLRMLKFPKTLFAELSRPDRLGDDAGALICGFVVTSRPAPDGNGLHATNKLAGIDVLVLTGDGAPKNRLAVAIEEVIGIPPLSKFGVAASVRLVNHRTWQSTRFPARLGRGPWYLYKRGSFNRYDSNFSPAKMGEFLRSLPATRWKVPPILSRLRIDVQTPIQ